MSRKQRFALALVVSVAGFVSVLGHTSHLSAPAVGQPSHLLAGESYPPMP